jgi:hypothetical protein
LFLRARARQWPAQSPVAPKKARVWDWDIVLLVMFVVVFDRVEDV